MPPLKRNRMEKFYFNPFRVVGDFIQKHRNKNKKAQSLLDVIIFIVIAIVIVVFFGLWRYGFNIITTSLEAVETPVNSLGINISQSATQTFGAVNIGLISLKTVGLCLIFGMIITIFISSFLVKAHPVFFAGYIMISIIAVIFAMMISTSYSNLMLDPIMFQIFTSDPAGSFILDNLAIWVTIIAFIGAILLFAGINKDDGMGGGLG